MHIWISQAAFLGVCLAVMHFTCKIAVRSRATPFFGGQGISAGREAGDRLKLMPVRLFEAEGSDFKTRSHVIKAILLGIGLSLCATAVLVLMETGMGSPAPQATQGSDSGLSGNIFGLGMVVVAFSFAPISYKRLLDLTLLQVVAVYMVVAGAIAAWYFFQNWLVVDVLAVILVFQVILTFQPWVSFLKAWVVSLVLAALYDCVNVYASGLMVKSVVGSLGRLNPSARDSHDLVMPFSVLLPDSLSLSAQISGLVGLGDIVGSCILILIAARASWRSGNPWLYRAAMAGFVAGFVLCGVVVSLTHSGQPATIFLFPAIGLATILTARKFGLLSELAKLPYEVRIR